MSSGCGTQVMKSRQINNLIIERLYSLVSCRFLYGCFWNKKAKLGIFNRGRLNLMLQNQNLFGSCTSVADKRCWSPSTHPNFVFNQPFFFEKVQKNSATYSDWKNYRVDFMK